MKLSLCVPLKQTYLLPLCVCVCVCIIQYAYMYVCVPHVHTAQRRPKRCIAYPGTAAMEVAKRHVGAGSSGKMASVHIH